MFAAHPPDRLDRRVQRSRVRMGSGDSRHRVKFALEEALRLAELPGEQEGRVYYFRKLSLGAVPARASRSAWLNCVQQALSLSAVAALHGCDPRADAAQAVYFDSEEQVLESQLRRALRSGSPPAWFTAAALAAAPAHGEAQPIVVRIVDRLRQSMPCKAAATLILAALGDANPAELLARLPTAAIRAWLQEWDAGRGTPWDAPAIPLPRHLKSTLGQTATQFGWQEPRTVWLATLIVQSLSPASATAESTVRRARSTLRQIAAEESGGPLQHDAAVIRPGDDLARVMIVREKMPRDVAGREEGPGVGREVGIGAGHDQESVGALRDAAERSNLDVTAAAKRGSQRPPVVWTPVLGEPTAAAGLYFLLQALRQLGIKDALARAPELAATSLVPRILKRLAAHAKVPAEDPILWCLEIADAELPPAEEALARLWAVRVRRWCWREGRITVREIVNREGRVWLTRTDLDVTLPMDEADVRIRRVGLDIDPGWLPWFGKIVRFHYRDRDPA
jgi:hypothetical protein